MIYGVSSTGLVLSEEQGDWNWPLMNSAIEGR